MSNSKISIKKWMYLIVAIVGVIGIMIYLKSSGILGYMSSIDEFKGYIESLGSKAYIVFFIIQLISIIVAPIPSNVSAVAGAIVLGMWESFIITTLAIVIGSAIIFSLSRIYGRMFVEKFVSKKLIEKYENLINSPKGESVIFLMLLLPFFPDDIINFIVGISNMSFKKYFVILMLTRPWEILLASALGSASLEMPLWGWGVIIIVSYFIIAKSSKIEEKLTKLIKKEA
ncbi:TVP38/TMEM64 family protein [Clostridium tertium]|uniref:TVP38/TMEM64 family membrane protein n=1 Tax=Clostridium tertium TaxID=1559 RepID=A0A6N2ZWN1_9CLOT